MLADRLASLEAERAAFEAADADPGDARSAEAAGGDRRVLAEVELEHKKVSGQLADLEQARRAQVAAEALGRHVAGPLRASAGGATAGTPPDLAEAQAAADAELRAEGLGPIGLLAVRDKPLPVRSPPKGMLAGITDGVKAFFSDENAEQRTLIVYLLVGLLIFTTLTTGTSD